MFGPVSVAYVILSFHHAHSLAQGLGGAHGEPQNVHPLKDAPRREARHTSSGMVWAQRENTPGSSPTGQ
jgi:hypothetical protein